MQEIKQPIERVLSEDGSWTCFNAEIGEHYHNLRGAYTEAQSVYTVPTRLKERLSCHPHLCVLDPFLGLGYNTLSLMSAFNELRQSDFPDATLTIIAIEYDPQILEFIPQVVESLEQHNLKQFLPLFEHNIYYQTQGDFQNVFQIEQRSEIQGITLSILIGDTRQIIQQLPAAQFNCIYHDAFSQKRQPELWTQTLFEQYKRILKRDDGCILTYSASASVRNAFKNLDMHLYKIENVLSKPGTAAYLQPQTGLRPLSDLEQALMTCRSGIPYEDSKTLSLPAETIVSNRTNLHSLSSLPSATAIHNQYGGHIRQWE